MARKGLEYVTNGGVEVAETESNWMTVRWGKHQLIVAQIGIRDQFQLFGLSSNELDDRSRAAIADVLNPSSEEDDFSTMARFLQEVDEDVEEYLLVYPGGSAECRSAMLTKTDLKATFWTQEDDARYNRGWRWSKKDEFYPSQRMTIVFNGKKHTVTAVVSEKYKQGKKKKK